MSLSGKPGSQFQVFGYTGFLFAFVQSALLVRRLGLAELTLLGLTGIVILTFYLLMTVTKILAGREVIIYYHHEIAVIATSTLFLRTTGQRALPYLDILVLGLGLFLALGRIGCLMVGCCHGRLCSWGIEYGEDHAGTGFPHYLVGVRLFPIQALESILAFSIVVWGLFLLSKEHQPGSIFLFYVVTYGCGRFCLEFLRGDAARPYLYGFSEAQWTSLLLAIAALVAEHGRIIPTARWHTAATIAIVAAVLLTQLRRRFDRSKKFELLHPVHVREISIALHHLRSIQPQSDVGAFETGAVHIVHTSGGYRISAGSCATALETIEHFSVSKDGAVLSPEGANIFSTVLGRLSGYAGPPKRIQSETGVFHVLFTHR